MKEGIIIPPSACNHGERDVILITPDGEINIEAGLVRGEYTQEVNEIVEKFGADKVRIINSKFTHDFLDYGE